MYVPLLGEALLEPTHIGGAGAFLLYVLYKEAIPRLLKLRTAPANGSLSKTAGGQSVEFWQQQLTVITTNSMTMALSPILKAQTDVLEEIRDNLKLQGRDNARVLTGIQILMDRSNRQNPTSIV
jgi:hypothetical protein